MINWLTQQARVLGATIRRLVRSPVGTALNVIVLGVTLALPAGLYLGLANLQSAARGVAPEPQLTVFLVLDAARTDVRDIDARLKQHAGVRHLRYIPRDEALKDMQRTVGVGAIAEALGQNPLPDAFVVDAVDSGAGALERLRAEIAGWPKVARVQLDAEWAQRLDAVLELGRVALLVLATLLAFALVAVTFNTIRLQILTQKEEVEVATLIGATAGFIRRPFLYHGAVLGLLGGLAACGLVALAARALSGALADLAKLYGADWRLAALTPLDAVSLLAFAAILGWLGAWLSVSRHLAQAQPR